MPARAGLALATGRLPAIEADAGVVPVEAFVLAVLAGGATRQRPAAGDLVFVLGSFRRDRRGVAAVDRMPGEQQPATRQAGVDTGQSRARRLA